MVDVVTDHRANLHNLLMSRLSPANGEPFTADLYASAYRPVGGNGSRVLEVWQEPLAVGDPLPRDPALASRRVVLLRGSGGDLRAELCGHPDAAEWHGLTMSETNPEAFVISPDQAGATLAAVLRRSARPIVGQVRRLIATRQARVNGELCLDEPAVSRRATPSKSWPGPLHDRTNKTRLSSATSTRTSSSSRSRPASTRCAIPPSATGPRAARPVADARRHRAEADRRARRPACAKGRCRDCASSSASTRKPAASSSSRARWRPSANLGKQFHAHTVIRRYLAVVPGDLPAQTIGTRLVRDRGDGPARQRRRSPASARRRSRTSRSSSGCAATRCWRAGWRRDGRIRFAFIWRSAAIPFAAKRCTIARRATEAVPDRSGAPRLALHAAELGFSIRSRTWPCTGKCRCRPDLARLS